MDARIISGQIALVLFAFLSISGAEITETTPEVEISGFIESKSFAITKKSAIPIVLGWKVCNLSKIPVTVQTYGASMVNLLDSAGTRVALTDITYGFQFIEREHLLTMGAGESRFISLNATWVTRDNQLYFRFLDGRNLREFGPIGTGSFRLSMSYSSLASTPPIVLGELKSKFPNFKSNLKFSAEFNLELSVNLNDHSQENNGTTAPLSP